MHSSERLKITMGLLLLTLCGALYAIPTTRSLVLSIDEQAFYLLNGSLQSNTYWASVWFYMNHNVEKYMNMVVFIFLNIYIITKEESDKRLIMVWNLLLLFVFLQIAIILKDGVLFKLLEIERASPSRVLTPFISLSEMFDSQNVKTSSGSSFPGGHAFAAAFWAFYTCTFVKRKFWPLVWVVAVPVMIGRLFSGAHWLSDVVVSLILAWAFVSAFVYTTANIKLASALRKCLYYKR